MIRVNTCIQPKVLMEHVVLVDPQNAVLGTLPKAHVHTLETPLHRGFSVFIFNQHVEFVLRASRVRRNGSGCYSTSREL
jgi:isopentenyl-diphosphate delta-isomerase